VGYIVDVSELLIDWLIEGDLSNTRIFMKLTLQDHFTFSIDIAKVKEITKFSPVIPITSVKFDLGQKDFYKWEKDLDKAYNEQARVSLELSDSYYVEGKIGSINRAKNQIILLIGKQYHLEIDMKDIESVNNLDERAKETKWFEDQRKKEAADFNWSEFNKDRIDAEVMLKAWLHDCDWNVVGHYKKAEYNDNKEHLAVVIKRTSDTPNVNDLFEIGWVHFLCEDIGCGRKINDCLYEGDSVQIIAWLDDDLVTDELRKLEGYRIPVDLLTWMSRFKRK
jgi:hypothetical protein